MFPHILDINFDTSTLYELAGLERADIEPPVTQHLTDQEPQTLPPQPLGLDLPLSTAVERPVKAAAAGARVCADPTEQNGAAWRRSLRGRKTRAQPGT